MTIKVVAPFLHDFHWDVTQVVTPVAGAHYQLGLWRGGIASLPPDLRTEFTDQVMNEEAAKVGVTTSQLAGLLQAVLTSAGDISPEQISAWAGILSIDCGYAIRDEFVSWFNMTALDPITKAGMVLVWQQTFLPGMIDLGYLLVQICLCRGASEALCLVPFPLDIGTGLAADARNISAPLLAFSHGLAEALRSGRDRARPLFDLGRFRLTFRDVVMSPRQDAAMAAVVRSSQARFSLAEWADLAGGSTAEASQDIADLVARGVLVPAAGGYRVSAF